MSEINDLAKRYIAVWNEQDAQARAASVAELWATEGIEFTESSQFKGHPALVDRVAQAHAEFVDDGGFVFEVGDEVNGHHDAAVFTTRMVPATGGDVAWSGIIVLILDEDGRIRRDYQFAN
jgi:hypothetical protein